MRAPGIERASGLKFRELFKGNQEGLLNDVIDIGVLITQEMHTNRFQPIEMTLIKEGFSRLVAGQNIFDQLLLAQIALTLIMFLDG
jgi:hypothetical protein